MQTKQLESGLHVPIGYQIPTPEETINRAVKTRGFSGRESVSDPKEYKAFGSLNRIYPTETGSWRYQRVNPSVLSGSSVSDIINTCIQHSPEMAFAVDTYVRFTNSGHDLIAKKSDGDADSEDDTESAADDESKRAAKIIYDFIDRLEEGDSTFSGRLDQMVRSYYAEGGIAAELVFSDDGEEAIDIVNVSPFTLAFRFMESETYNGYYQVGQFKTFDDFVVLQDKADPNPTFRYEPNNQVPGKPYGTSSVTPAIFGVLSTAKLMDMVIQYMQGQAFPKGLVSVDTDTMARAGFAPDDISDAAAEATEELRNILSSTDATQTVVLSTPILYTLLGAMSRANINGAEMILEMLTQSQQRGLKLPRIIFGGRRASALGVTEGRVEWHAFQKRLRSTRSVIESIITHFFTIILRAHGNTATIKLKLDDTDEEGMRISAERLAMDTDSVIALASAGIISRQEARDQIIASNTRFESLPSALPADAIPAAVERPSKRSLERHYINNGSNGKGKLEENAIDEPTLLEKVRNIAVEEVRLATATG